jgi:hypothetical protein
MPKRKHRSRPFFVTEPRHLLAIASPGRDEIVDTVALIGPCTVPAMASVLGRSRHSLYYHVKALARVGLLVETGYAPVGGKAVMQYDLPGRPLFVMYDLRTPASRRAVARLGETRLRSAARDFRRACDPRVAVVSGSQRNLWVASWEGWLSPKDLKRVNRLLHMLIGSFRPPSHTATRNGRRPHKLTFALSPILGKRSTK